MEKRYGKRTDFPENPYLRVHDLKARFSWIPTGILGFTWIVWVRIQQVVIRLCGILRDSRFTDSVTIVHLVLHGLAHFTCDFLGKVSEDGRGRSNNVREIMD